MTYEEIIAEVASATGLPKKFVDRTYRAYWKIVRHHIVSLPLKESLSDEQFLALKPNVNIPSIGKLNVTLDRYHSIKKHFDSSCYETYKKKHKLGKYAEDKEN